MKEVKYTYHHTASDRGYIPVGKEIKEPYRGKYGRGYIIKRNNPRSNRFYLKDYYIREVNNYIIFLKNADRKENSSTWTNTQEQKQRISWKI